MRKKLLILSLTLLFSTASTMQPNDSMCLSYTNLDTITPQMYIGQPFTVLNTPALHGARFQEIRTSGFYGNCGYISLGITRERCLDSTLATLSTPNSPSYLVIKSCVNHEIAQRYEDWIQNPNENYNLNFNRLTQLEKKYLITYSTLLKIYDVNDMGSQDFSAFLQQIETLGNASSCINSYMEALRPYSQGEIKNLIKSNLSNIRDPERHKLCVKEFLQILTTERSLEEDPYGKYFASFEPEGILDGLSRIHGKTVFIFPRESSLLPCNYALQIGVAPTLPINFHSDSIRFISHNSIESHFSRVICVNN